MTSRPEKRTDVRNSLAQTFIETLAGWVVGHTTEPIELVSPFRVLANQHIQELGVNALTRSAHYAAFRSADVGSTSRPKF